MHRTIAALSHGLGQLRPPSAITAMARTSLLPGHAMLHARKPSHIILATVYAARSPISRSLPDTRHASRPPMLAVGAPLPPTGKRRGAVGLRLSASRRPMLTVRAHLLLREQALIKELRDGRLVHLDPNKDQLLPMIPKLLGERGEGGAGEGAGEGS